MNGKPIQIVVKLIIIFASIANQIIDCDFRELQIISRRPYHKTNRHIEVEAYSLFNHEIVI